MNRVGEEKAFWDNNALDPEVDKKYICDVDTELCLQDLGSMDGKVLEIGCGVGRLMQPEWNGIDISINMIKIANKRGFKYAIQHDGRTIPFTNESFDFVYSYLLFQHLKIDAIKQYIDEAHRVLKDHGVFIFQFIEGYESEPFSNHYPQSVIKKMADKYSSITFKKSVAYDGWTIARCTK